MYYFLIYKRDLDLLFLLPMALYWVCLHHLSENDMLNLATLGSRIGLLAGT